MLMNLIYFLAAVGFCLGVNYLMNKIPVTIRAMGVKRVYLEFQEPEGSRSEKPEVKAADNDNPKQLKQ